MAVRRKPQPRKIKFELSRTSIGGIGVVVFCIFLWMFLFGVWAGQSLLAPSHSVKKTIAEKSHVDAEAPKVIRAEKKAVKKKADS